MSDPNTPRRVAFADPQGRIIGTRTMPSHVASNLAARWTISDISEDEMAEIQAGGSWRLEDGKVVSAALDNEQVAAIRAHAQARVDADAEKARLRFLTAGAGQAREYEETAQEALAVAALSEPLADADWPFLAAEKAAQASIGRLVSISEIAAEVRAARAVGLAGLAEIKLRRRQAKLAIQAATTESEAQAVINALTWPEPEGAS